ncbi:hypothetical protein MRX96_018582 [Rhipicephalus microplus]
MDVSMPFSRRNNFLRPKRNASTKGLGCSNGLHWMEEKQLKKALYASLNETKKARLLDENTSEDSREQTPKTSTTTVVTKKAADIDSKRIKVHAQRKFAQGSNPNSPMPTPVKLLPPCRDSKETVSQPSTLLPCKRRPKTEDFLTFLCLRGSSALPPALDFMSGTAFSGSSSSSDRSSSPDLDAPVTSTNAESKDKGGSGNAHGGTASAELRSQAQRTSARVLKQERRPLRLDNGEEKQRIEHRASRSAIVKKVDKKKAASEKLKNVYKTGSTSRSHRKSSGNLTALQEKPTTEEMRDPISYITKIRPEAEKFGICKIVLPPSFQPECKVFDDMRFTAYNQYIHKMLSRWGPNVQHMACIKRCFTNQGITDDQPPLIGGIELDLSHLYHTVQNFGGIQQVMEKKKWHRVADAMHIPKAAQDRVSKVDDAYCKFVLPYDLLSADEKKAIERQVLADRERQMAAESEPSSTSADEDEEDEFSNECVAKGRNISLSVFSRVARNTMSMWYKHEPSTEEVEKDYWNLVIDQRRHVCVHAGNIDSSVHGSGFPTNRLVPFAKHPWNLKVLTNNPGTVLRCMGPVSGVTIPTLHLSMLYTTGCWYRDPHCLPWIEYLHTGANKIWYSVPAHSSNRFRAAMKEIMPQVCKDSVIWLPSDCAMVPPPQLVEHGCPLSRLVQEKGQFVVIFPGAFTSTIACGYSVSESVYFATQDWLLQAAECFEHMKASCEPPTFSFEKLILGIATEHRENLDTCRWTLPLLRKMCENEQRYRTQLVEMGLKTFERLRLDEAAEPKKRSGQGYDLKTAITSVTSAASVVMSPWL